jgi:hypothetical protein
MYAVSCREAHFCQPLLKAHQNRKHACMANLYNIYVASSLLKNEQSFKLYLKGLKAFVYHHKLYDFADEFEAFVAK